MRLLRENKDFIGLRAKLYCFNTSNQEIKKAKGVKKKIIERDIKNGRI